MNKLQDTHTLFEDLSRICDKIINKSLKFDEQKDLYVNILCAKTKKDEKEIEPIVSKNIHSLVDDPKIIKKELPIFIEYLIGNKTFDEIDAPFLKQVWCGDAYDSRGVQSFRELLVDMKEQLMNCTEETIVRLN